MTLWKNWSGLESTAPDLDLVPADTDAVVAAVRKAREAGRTVKMVGTGHSFTGVGAPEGVMLRPDAMRGMVDVMSGQSTAHVPKSAMCWYFSSRSIAPAWAAIPDAPPVQTDKWSVRLIRELTDERIVWDSYRLRARG
jgi:hypothetical protein